MRQLTFVFPGHVEWQDAPDPKFQFAHAAVVRPPAIGRCVVDPAYIRGMAPFPSGEQTAPLLAICLTASRTPGPFHPATDEQTQYAFSDAPEAGLYPTVRIVAPRP